MLLLVLALLSPALAADPLVEALDHMVTVRETLDQPTTPGTRDALRPHVAALEQWLASPPTDQDPFQRVHARWILLQAARPGFDSSTCPRRYSSADCSVFYEITAEQKVASLTAEQRVVLEELVATGAPAPPGVAWQAWLDQMDRSAADPAAPRTADEPVVNDPQTLFPPSIPGWPTWMPAPTEPPSP